jgi:HlyD family secretion protein
MHPANPNKLLSLCLSLAFLGGHGLLRAEDEPKSASDSEPKALKISGVFEALSADEISADTEQITSLVIKRILPHGTKVSKGQNVVSFDSEDIDKKIKDAEIDLRLSKLTLEDDEFSYKQFQETQSIDRGAAARAHKNAQQDYDNFVQVDRDRLKLTAEYNLKSSQASLENAMEELKQLEQMYMEDELTEESEEIVLKRAKRSVEIAQYRLAGTKISSQRSVSQSIPRTQAKQEDSLAKAHLAHQKSIRDLTSARQKRDIEMKRKRDKFKEEEKKFSELREERKQIALTSALDGIVLHGKLTRGKLSAKPSVLEAGSKVTAKQVVATVVSPKKLQIRVDLDEKNLAVVSPGTKCKLTVKAFPDFEGAATIKSVSAVPYAGTSYDCVATFRQTKNLPAIMPTMTCELEFELEDDAATDDQPNKKNGKAKGAKENK